MRNHSGTIVFSLVLIASGVHPAAMSAGSASARTLNISAIRQKIQMLSQPVEVSRVITLQAESTNPKVSSSAPQCEIVGTSELTITCIFAAAESSGADSRTIPRVILNRAEISFKTSNESHMRVELSFTNDSGSEITQQRTIYLAIDDEKGENHMRRPLPHVDFTKLGPGVLTQFQETLLAPAFGSGRYVVSLWIPSSDSSLKFLPAHNFLLSSAGVPDPATGLNQLAQFTVIASGRRKSAAVPD
jgi:hypothetical protein